MSSSILENPPQANGRKYLWVVCNNIDESLEEDSSLSVMDLAKTPNLDKLCSQSETGLLHRSIYREVSSVDEEFVSGLSALEIDGTDAALAMLEGMFNVSDREMVDDLPSVERILGNFWSDYDLFVLRLNYLSVAEPFSENLSPVEWIEMLDAWLPGLYAYRRPDVFAISGDVWVGVGRNESLPAPALLHSKKSRARSTRGFNLDCCRHGCFGSGLSLGEWLRLLLSHGTDRNEK